MYLYLAICVCLCVSVKATVFLSRPLTLIPWWFLRPFFRKKIRKSSWNTAVNNSVTLRMVSSEDGNTCMFIWSFPLQQFHFVLKDMPRTFFFSIAVSIKCLKIWFYICTVCRKCQLHFNSSFPYYLSKQPHTVSVLLQ